MKTSQRGMDLIKKHEGLRLKAYVCPAGKLTIGYGHTGRDVYDGLEITEDIADALLRKDLATFEWQLSNLVTVPVTQNQFDAMLSLLYNIGSANFRKSTLLRLVLNNPDNPAIPSEFLRWKYAGGKALPGLVARRKDEAALYSTV